MANQKQQRRGDCGDVIMARAIAVGVIASTGVNEVRAWIMMWQASKGCMRQEQGADDKDRGAIPPILT